MSEFDSDRVVQQLVPAFIEAESAILIGLALLIGARPTAGTQRVDANAHGDRHARDGLAPFIHNLPGVMEPIVGGRVFQGSHGITGRQLGIEKTVLQWHVETQIGQHHRANFDFERQPGLTIDPKDHVLPGNRVRNRLESLHHAPRRSSFHRAASPCRSGSREECRKSRIAGRIKAA